MLDAHRRHRTSNMEKAILAAGLLTLLAVPSTALAQAGDPEPQNAAEQTIQPGDVIRLRIWREPDMSGEFQVDEGGLVIFPRIGEYRVLEDTPTSLEATLLQEYLRYLRNPTIEITILRRVQVRGAVRNPGLYPVDPTLTLSDVIAVAGGATPNGDPKKIELFRDGLKLTTLLNANTTIAESPIRSGDQIFVPERSWFSRNTGLVATGITATVSVILALVISR